MDGNKLSYRFLGKSGLKVSEICLGTGSIGPQEGGCPKCTEEVAHQLFDKFVEFAGNFIDTANTYSDGKAEEIIGNWLHKQPREKMIIASKVKQPVGDGPNDCGLSRSHIFHQVDQSLMRLQTDYIDLYQTHVWDMGVPLEETLSALNDLVQMGKVRYIGCCNLKGWHLQKAVDICNYRNFAPCITLQQQYNLLCRDSEYDAFEVCRLEGIGVIPHSPLKGYTHTHLRPKRLLFLISRGLLSGRYRRGSPLSSLDDMIVGWAVKQKNKEHFITYEEIKSEKTLIIIDLLEKIGKCHGKTMAQVSLRWLLQKDNVSSVIIGPKTLSELDDNLGAIGDWRLTQQEAQQLDEASARVPPYPHDTINRYNVGRQTIE